MLDQLVNGVGSLISKIDELKVPELSQAPADYTPMRRVVKIGERLVFDDSVGGSRGGGGSGVTQYVDTNGVTQNVSPSYPLPVDITDAEINVELDQPTSAAVTSVSDTVVSTTLIAANTSRKKVRIYNNSSSTLYVKEGTTASATDFTVALYQDDYFETTYTGRIDGIWSADSTGAALITEET